EGVDGGAGLEVQVPRRVEAFEQVAQERGDVVHAEGRIVLPGADEEVFGQGELVRAEHVVRDGQDLLGPALGRVEERRVALAADGEAERVDAGGVDGVDLAEPGDLAGYGVAGQLVD